jgi:peptide deformylase
MKGCIVMAVRNILTIGEETLRKKSREVTVFDRRLHILLEDMAKTLENAHGIGLAAPQIGILKRVVVIFDSEKRIELVNPVIIETLGEQQKIEGCLSIPGKYGITKRPETVTVDALDRKGNEFTISGTGLLARAFCHEIDHLNGVLYIDNVIRILTEAELENT